MSKHINITRRHSLGLMAAATMPVYTPAANARLMEQAPIAAERAENPILLIASDGLKNAVDDLAAAKEALEWLVDEWRHLWPLAPEQILGFANAQRSGGNDYADAERDIAGRYLFRDTSSLTKRFSKKMRQEWPSVCFGVIKPEPLRKSLLLWQGPVKAKTAAALVKKRIEQEKVIKKLQEQIRLSEQYYAEIERLRIKSGAYGVKARIAEAENRIKDVCRDISEAEAFTVVGLQIKANALYTDQRFIETIRSHDGILGNLARFVDTVSSVLEGCEA